MQRLMVSAETQVRYDSAVTSIHSGAQMPMFKRGCVILLLISAAACSPTAPYGGLTAPSTSSITITGTVPSVGQTSQLTAKATLSNGTSQDVTAHATWSSSDAAVATVTTGGLLKVLQLGHADITATYQGVSGKLSAVLPLSAVLLPSSLSVSLSSSYMITRVPGTDTYYVDIGETGTLHAIAMLSNGTTQDVTADVTWQSSNTSVAAVGVGGNNVLTPQGFGAADIIAMYPGESFDVTGRIHILVTPPGNPFCQ